MRRTILCAALGLMALAQGPVFEVASIRKNTKGPTPDPSAMAPPPPPPSIRSSAGSVTILYASLMDCLTWAYGVRRWQISGPDWISVERFDISAKAPGPAPVSQLKLMLRALLAERFRMSARWEKRDKPVMALVLDKSGPKFKAAAPGVKFDEKFSFGPGGIRSTYRNAEIGVLENLLTIGESEPVIDMTGLTGGFDFTYQRPPRDPENGEAWLAHIQTSLQSQLGLRLERRKAPVDFLVIERAEKMPTEN